MLTNLVRKISWISTKSTYHNPIIPLGCYWFPAIGFMSSFTFMAITRTSETDERRPMEAISVFYVALRGHYSFPFLQLLLAIFQQFLLIHRCRQKQLQYILEIPLIVESLFLSFVGELLWKFVTLECVSILGCWQSLQFRF